MLIFSRKNRESVVIGNGLERMLKVTVLEIRGRYVKLDFEANPDIAVHRSEIWERLCGDDLQASPVDAAVVPVA